MTLAGFEELPGAPLQPGTVVIPDEERQTLAAILGGPVPEGGSLHPLHAYVAMQRGIGASIEDLCRAADFELEDGPMMGSIDLQIDEPLSPDTEYAVAGELVDLVRKQGRAIGVFDLLTYRERLVDASGRTVASVTNTFVLPRKALS
jgi:hypothetical protein